MRLSISNIAWEPHEDSVVADLLQRNRVDAIDIAPGKYFPAPGEASSEDIARVADAWRNRGIEIVGMQALLFGTQGLNVFGDDASRAAMLSHLAEICRIGGELGARRLVFGSPKNRDRTGLDDSSAQRLAVDFFRRVGDIAHRHDVIICLEPNPERYGANFMTSGAETSKIVRAVGHDHIKMQFDTGALTLSGEDPNDLLSSHATLVGHVHASEPDLVPLGDGPSHHAGFRAALERFIPRHVVCIEMVATCNEDHVTSIARALCVADQYYRRPEEPSE